MRNLVDNGELNININFAVQVHVDLVDGHLGLNEQTKQLLSECMRLCESFQLEYVRFDKIL